MEAYGDGGESPFRLPGSLAILRSTDAPYDISGISEERQSVLRMLYGPRRLDGPRYGKLQISRWI